MARNRHRARRTSVHSPRPGSAESSTRGAATPHDESHRAPTGGLPHAFVATTERERLVAAVADVVGVVGYEAMTLQDVATHAGVDADVVRGYFADEEDAFLSTYGEAVWQGFERLLSAIREPTGFADRIWAGWQAFVEFVVAEPAIASMCIVDVLAVRPAGIERRDTTLRGIAALIEQTADESLGPDRLRPPELYLSIVLGGFAEIFREHLATGRIAQLPAIVPSLHFTLIVPYIGHAQALEEYERRERAAVGGWAR